LGGEVGKIFIRGLLGFKEKGGFQKKQHIGERTAGTGKKMMRQKSCPLPPRNPEEEFAEIGESKAEARICTGKKGGLSW